MTNEKIGLKEVARYWDDNAETWTKHVAAGWDTTREYFQIPAFLEFIGDISGLHILDAGCGEGTNTRLFARLGGKLTGIDISEKMVGFGREREREGQLGIEYYVGSYSDLGGFDDGKFDMVLSTMALMDGPDFKGTIREFYRVLRPGGKMAFSILHPIFAAGDRMDWRLDENGEADGITVSNYFTREPSVARWQFGANPDPKDVELFKIPYFPRTLAQYINGVCDAGFRIDSIAEPRPTEATIVKFPDFEKHREHGSFLFFLKATKPE